MGNAETPDAEEPLLEASEFTEYGVAYQEEESRAKKNAASSVNRGLALAFVAGLLYSFQFVPFQIHNAQHKVRR